MSPRLKLMIHFRDDMIVAAIGEDMMESLIELQTVSVSLAWVNTALHLR